MQVNSILNLAIIAKEMYRYNLTLLRLSETRLTQSGTTRLHCGELIIYSGGKHVLKFVVT